MLFEELALAANVAAVTLGNHVLAQRLNGFAGNDFLANAGLNGDVEHLAGQQFAQLLAEAAAPLVALGAVHDGREGVHLLPVEHHVELHHVRLAEANQLIIQRGVAAADALELVEEVEHNFRQRQLEAHLHPLTRQVALALDDAALVHAQRDNGPDVLRGGDNLRLDERLLDALYQVGLRHVGGSVDGQLLVLRADGVELHAGHGGNHRHVEFALEALLHDFHVQHAQKAAAEAEAQRHGSLRLPHQRGVVELQLFHAGAQLFVLSGINGVDAGEYHRLHVGKALDGLRRGAVHVGDSIAYLHLAGLFDARDEVAHVAGPHFLARLLVEAQDADFIGAVLLAGGHEAELVALFHGAVLDAEQDFDAAVGVEYRVENQGLQRRFGVALGGGHALADGIQDFLDADAGLARGVDDVVGVAADEVHDFVGHLLRHGVRQVDFVEHRNDFQVGPNGEVEVGNRLGLNTLRGIHDEQGALAGGNAAAHLVAEVDVAGRINQVERVRFPVVGVLHLDGMALDSDATLTLQVHVVEQLGLHVALGHGAREFKKPVGQGAFAVVDVGNNAKVADILQRRAVFSQREDTARLPETAGPRQKGPPRPRGPGGGAHGLARARRLFAKFNLFSRELPYQDAPAG